jgi:hypothetical protein
MATITRFGIAAGYGAPYGICFQNLSPNDLIVEFASYCNAKGLLWVQDASDLKYTNITLGPAPTVPANTTVVLQNSKYLGEFLGLRVFPVEGGETPPEGYRWRAWPTFNI